MPKKRPDNTNIGINPEEIINVFIKALMTGDMPYYELQAEAEIELFMNQHRDTILVQAQSVPEASLLIALLHKQGRYSFAQDESEYHRYMRNANSLLANRKKSSAAAHIYEVYRATLQKQHQHAANALQQLADLGYHYYAFLYAQKCLYGDGIKRNLQTAIKYFEKAAKSKQPVLAQPSLIHLKNLNEKIKRTRTKVQHPLFFKISNSDNKSAYVLGTHHYLTAAVLPQKVLDIIFSCKSMFAERTKIPSEHEQSEFIAAFKKGGILHLDKYDDNWFDKLQTEDKGALIVKFNTQFKRLFGNIFTEGVKLPRVDTLKLGFVLYILEMSNLSNDTCSIDIDETVCGSMDKEIKSLFYNSQALEPYFNALELLGLQEEAEISTLIKAINGKSIYEQNAEDNIGWHNYSAAGVLYDHADLCEEEQIDEQQNGSREERRNNTFVSNILNYFASTSGPTLFCFGDAHLGGKSGILEQLRKHNFTIEIFDHESSIGASIDATFKPFEYGYRHYAHEIGQFKRSMIFGYKHPLGMSKCTDLVIYEPPTGLPTPRLK